MGPLVVTAAGKARSDGTPVDVDVELATMFLVSDENQSNYLQRNIDTFAGDPGSVDPEDDGFIESNKMHSINGLMFGNLTGLTMRKGQRVRWYLMGMGTEVDLHTPHWHGNTVLVHGARADVVDLLPATLLSADMVPDDVGTWLYHCHVGDRILRACRPSTGSRHSTPIGLLASVAFCHGGVSVGARPAHLPPRASPRDGPGSSPQLPDVTTGPSSVGGLDLRHPMNVAALLGGRRGRRALTGRVLVARAAAACSWTSSGPRRAGQNAAGDVSPLEGEMACVATGVSTIATSP
jgi:hypothetical protein